jgi:hypothetical protein
MIGDQAKILCGPGLLDRPTPWEIGIAPVRIVAQDQLFRCPGNRVLAWEPGQMGQDQFAPRFESHFNQGDHALSVKIEPALSTADNVERLRWKRGVFGGTGHKTDIEMFLGSNDLGVRNGDTDELGGAGRLTIAPPQRALLAPLSAWCTAGCDTADLQEARALRDALGGRTTSARRERTGRSHGPSYPRKNARTNPATCAGCSMEGMWPAWSTSSTRAPGIRLANSWA